MHFNKAMQKLSGQARNQLGTQGGAEFSERGPNFFKYVE